MKVKWDFVTNSSSCCYLIACSIETRKSDIEKQMRPAAINHFHFIDTIEELISYTEGTGQPCDWVMKARGPVKFWGMKREWYDISKPIIENGDYILCVDIERNFDDVESFENLGFDILDSYYD